MAIPLCNQRGRTEARENAAARSTSAGASIPGAASRRASVVVLWTCRNESRQGLDVRIVTTLAFIPVALVMRGASPSELLVARA